MPRKESKVVPEGNDGPVPQQEEFGSGQPTLADVCRMFKERPDKSDRRPKKLSGETKKTDQRLASLEQDARQPRLAMEADGPADIKTRERTEGTAPTVQAMHGDSCSANRIDLDPMCSTSFGDDWTGPLTLPCSKEDYLVDNSAATFKSCLSSLKMRTTSVAGGLLPTGKTSTATEATYNQPPLRLYSTGETDSMKTNLRTPILSVSYDSSFFWMNDLPATPSCRRVIDTKSEQNRMFNPGCSRSSSRLPIVGNVAPVASWGGYTFWSGWWRSAVFFLAGRMSAEYHFAERGTSNSTAVFPQRLVLKSHSVEGGSRL